MSDTWSFETKTIHGDGLSFEKGSTTSPIYMSAGFEHESAETMSDIFSGRKFGHVYSRISNPSIVALEKRLTALEGGLGSVSVASGLSAIVGVVLALCESGDEIIVSKSIFGGTYDLFEESIKRMGIISQYVSPCSIDQIKAATSSKTRFIFLETLSNPKLDIPVFKEIVAWAKQEGVPVVIDSTMTTPALFDAKRIGVDVIVHSTTKYLTGSGLSIGGVVTDLGLFDWRNSRSEALQKAVKKWGQHAFLGSVRRHILHNVGSTLSPHSAFLTTIGLDTLALRMERHCSNAMAVAQFLEGHSLVTDVSYPGLESHPQHESAKALFQVGFGGLLTFDLKQKTDCFSFINALEMIKNIANLGDSKTLVIHPESTIFKERSEADAREAGVRPTTIRLSVGLENTIDIIQDLTQAIGGLSS